MLNVLAGMAFGALICWFSLVTGISLGIRAAKKTESDANDEKRSETNP